MESRAATSQENQLVTELQFKSSSKQMFHASNLGLFQDYPEMQEDIFTFDKVIVINLASRSLR